MILKTTGAHLVDWLHVPTQRKASEKLPWLPEASFPEVLYYRNRFRFDATTSFFFFAFDLLAMNHGLKRLYDNIYTHLTIEYY